LWCGMIIFAIMFFGTLSDPKFDLFTYFMCSAICGAVAGGIFAYIIFHRNE
jgi:hypothetical protein